MRILRQDTMALIVDYQEKLMPVIYDNKNLLERSRIFIEGLKTLEIPMLITEQYPKGLGNTVSEITKITQDVPKRDKTSFSCYEDPSIRSFIQKAGRKTILVCGVEAHICVLQTMIDLKEAGYNPVLISDCVSSRRKEDIGRAMMRAQQEDILITGCESVLFELVRTAQDPNFKAISKLLK